MKKLLVTLMALNMVVSMTACGSSEGTSATKETVVVENTTSVENAKASVEPSEVDTVNNKVEQQEAPKQDETQENNEILTVDSEYANLPESEGFVFEGNGDGTCTLTKFGVCSDVDIVIPEKSPTGDIVTKIGTYAFYDAEDVKNIIIAGRNLEIESQAFQYCPFEKLVISGCDLLIAESAFSYCEDVKEIIISNSNVEVESYAFYDTGKDMNVQITNCTGSLNKQSFQSSGTKDLVIADSSLVLEDNSFSYCEDITSITMENSVVEIGEYAFYDSGDDMVVDFTDCQLTMDSKAFQSSCLASLNITGEEVYVDENTFSYCEDLTDVVIDAKNIEIDSYAFYDCTSLVNVSIATTSDSDETQINIEDKAFQSCSVESVIVGKGAVELGDYAFSYCEDLVNVEFGGNSLDVGDYAFYECPDELIITYKGVPYNKESIQQAE